MDCELCKNCEDSVRRAPLASVGIAALAGLVASMLPIGAIIGAILRLAFALVRPGLVVLGVWKAVELWGKCPDCCARPIDKPEPPLPMSEAVS